MPRLARLALVAVAASSTLTLAPPARAVTSGSVALVGTMVQGPGVAYPCIDNGPVINAQKCLPPDTLVNGGNPNDALFTLSASAVGGLAKFNKPKCSVSICFSAGIYTINAAGAVHGACGLATGEGLGNLSGGTLGTKPGSTRSFSLSFIDVSGVLVVTGSFGRGPLSGTLLAIPDAPGGSSCTNKGPKRFFIAGQLVFADLNLLTG